MTYVSKKEQELKEIRLQGMGWTVYIVACADGSFFTGIARDMKREMFGIYKARGKKYFVRHPELLPLKIVYQEDHVPFREAFAKLSYLRDCNRTAKLYIIKNQMFGCSWKMYLRGFRDKNTETT
jgi:putative endonuclease